jgi:hypothetical protein
MYTVNWSKNGITYQNAIFDTAIEANAQWDNLKKQGFKYGGVSYGNNPMSSGPTAPGGSNKMILYIAAAAAAVLLLPKLLK